MTNMIISSLDKELSYLSNTESITLTPTLANQRFLAAYINELLDTCEIDCTQSVQDFADKFIGEPVGLAEGSMMMQLYDITVQDVAQKIARATCDDVWQQNHDPHPDITIAYQWAYLMHKVLTKDCLGFGLKPFREQIQVCTLAALNSINVEQSE